MNSFVAETSCCLIKFVHLHHLLKQVSLCFIRAVAMRFEVVRLRGGDASKGSSIEACSAGKNFTFIFPAIRMGSRDTFVL